MHWSRRYFAGQGASNVSVRYASAAGARATSARSSSVARVGDRHAQAADIAVQDSLEAELRSERERGMIGGAMEWYVHKGIEHGTALRACMLGHPFDQGRPHAAAPVGRVYRHGDFCAALVVTQRQLHHPHAEQQTAGVERRQEVEPPRRAAVPSEGTDVRQGEAGEIRPEVLVARPQDGGPCSQLVVVRRIDQAHLHRITLPRRSPFSAGRRRTPRPRRRCSGCAARPPPRP